MSALLRLFARLVGLLPERVVAWTAAGLGRLWFSVLRYRRRVILENLTRAFPELDPRARRRRARDACVHLVRTLLEFLRIPRYRRRGLDRFVRVEGLEHWFAAHDQGRGVLMLSGHLGSFELAVAAAAPQVTGAVHLLVKPFPPGVDRFINGVRRESGLSVIFARGGMRPAIRALRRNETVVFVLDQNATRSIGVFVDFFGHSACTMAGLAALARRTGAAVVPAIPHRAPDGTHVLRVEEAIAWEEQGSRDETIRHMTQVYTRRIEEAIRAHPEQWFWTHKRWRTRAER